MKIGIMGAMNQEISSIKTLMRDVKEENHAGRTYFTGKINDYDVVLVFSRWGKVASATTATVLISEFKIDQLIFTGVAGATAANLNIGDIVIADKLYQHDMDGRLIMPHKHEIPLTGITFFQADAALMVKAIVAAEELLRSIKQKISVDDLQDFRIVTPQCVSGMIATGDQFIASKSHIDAILAEKPDTMAVEMEGAAVAQVCTDYQIPFVVIRTISDKADHSAVIDFPAFIEKIASCYSEHIIAFMLKI